MHRCLERYGISRLPEIDGDKPEKQLFATYAIGYVHIDSAEVSTAEGKLRLLVAIDRTSKFIFLRLVESASKMEAAQFLRDFIESVPYRIHTVLTENGVQLNSSRQVIYDSQHIFDRVCDEHGIVNRLTKVNHPWDYGQVEQINRTIKDATVKRYHYDIHAQLRTHLHCSSMPTTMPVGSRPGAASRPPSSSLKPGPKSPIASRSIRHTSSGTIHLDHTAFLSAGGN